MRNGWSESWSHYEASEVTNGEVIITDVRLQSNAGWYIGALQFYDIDEMDSYSRDTDYYLNERMIQEDYPRSISLQEACDKVKNHPLYKRKLERWKTSNERSMTHA